MATIERPATHRDEVSVLLDLANRQYALAVAAVILLPPVGAYFWGDPTVLFYVHVALGAFWFGFDFFFKFVLGPSLDATSDEAAAAVNSVLVPKMVVVAEPLSLAVVGSGIGLAHLMGYWANPTIWLWGALGIGSLLLLVGFGPLHLLTTRMAVELNRSEPDAERIEDLFGKALQWGLLQTVFMLAIIVMMTGMRGV